MSHADISPIKVKITRAWTNLSPKLWAFLATGLSASLVITFAGYFGIEIPEGLASTIVVVVAAIAGYLKSDSAVIDAGTVTPGNVAVITALNTDGTPKA